MAPETKLETLRVPTQIGSAHSKTRKHKTHLRMCKAQLLSAHPKKQNSRRKNLGIHNVHAGFFLKLDVYGYNGAAFLNSRIYVETQELTKRLFDFFLERLVFQKARAPSAFVVGFWSVSGRPGPS